MIFLGEEFENRLLRTVQRFKLIMLNVLQNYGTRQQSALFSNKEDRSCKIKRLKYLKRAGFIPALFFC